MGGEEEKKLYDAARMDNTAALQQLLHEDPNLLERVSFASSNKTPLHVATMHGKANTVEMALDINPQLALDLDSRNSSPLHIAAAQGSLEIAKKLLLVAPETRWWRDSHDMNPVHIAAMKGHVEVLKELLRLDFFPAMERIHRGQTVLHLCVKHDQLPVLKVTAEKLGELVRAVDDDGETILHLAVRCKQLETIRYLVESKIIEKETQNSMGKTALDILNETPLPRTTYEEMKRILTKLVRKSVLQTNIPNLMDMILVMMVLIATMAFQAAVSPPGGVWQENTNTNTNTTAAVSPDNNNTSPHRAGEAVMASTHPTLYTSFVGSNVTAFVSSFVTIILIVSGLPTLHYSSLMMVMCAIGMSIAAISTSYGLSLTATGRNNRDTLVTIVVSVASIALIFLGLKPFFDGPKTQRRDLHLTPDHP